MRTILVTQELVDAVASEIETGFRAHRPHFEANDKPIRFSVFAPSLQGKRRGELDGRIEGSFAYTVSYHGQPSLRKGCGVIICNFESADGLLTGNVSVQAACDDFDL